MESTLGTIVLGIEVGFAAPLPFALFLNFYHFINFKLNEKKSIAFKLTESSGKHQASKETHPRIRDRSRE
jgi:hypothetical protein